MPEVLRRRRPCTTRIRRQPVLRSRPSADPRRRPAAALVVALTRDTGSKSSSRIEGSGVAQTVSRDVPAFSKVELAGVGVVRVHPGSPQGVAVSGDDNIVPLVTTEVRDGTRKPLVVDVRAPAVAGSILSGIGDLTVDGVSGRTFAVDLSGSGKLDVGGNVTALDATVSGTGAAWAACTSS